MCKVVETLVTRVMCKVEETLVTRNVYVTIRFALSICHRQIWLTMFITLLPNSHLWIIHMIGYHCSSLRKNTLEQK